MMQKQNYEVSNSGIFGNFKDQTYSTPKTAQSLSSQYQIDSNQQISFSSFISKTQNYFLAGSHESSQDLSLKLVKHLSLEQQQNFKQEKNKQQDKNIFDNFQIIFEEKSYQLHGIQWKKKQNYIAVETIQKQIFQNGQILKRQLKAKQPNQIQNNTKINYFINQIQNIQEKLALIRLKTKQKIIIQNIQQLVLSVRLLPWLFQRQILKVTSNQLQKPISGLKQKIFFESSQQNQFILIFPHKILIETSQKRFNLLNKSPQLNQITDLKDLRGILFQLSQQNMGSRIIQKLLHLNFNKKQSFKILQNQIQQKYSLLMRDKYGNYVVQKMFGGFNQEQKIMFFCSIEPDLVQIAKTKFGTFCLQSILNKCKNSYKCLQKIEAIIQNHVVQLVLNQFGVRFVNQCMIKSNSNLFNKIYFNYQNFIQISQHKQGIISVKCFMEMICQQTPWNLYLRNQFLTMIYNLIDDIFSDQYSTFLMQQLVKYYSQQQLYWIMSKILGNLQCYACNQHSSKFIRLTLKNFSYVWSSSIINFITQNKQMLSSLMNQKSGSYVVHTLIKVCDNLSKQKLLKLIKSQLWKIKEYQKKKIWLKYYNA